MFLSDKLATNSKMKKLPIIISFLLVFFAGYFVYQKKTITRLNVDIIQNNIGNFTRQKSCVKPPQFLAGMGIGQPVIIDLSQKRFKGIAFLHGKNMQQILHPKIWEQYEHFSTYTLDEYGNIYLAPMPFISIKPTTFNLQTKLYKLDSNTGKIEIWKDFVDVHPSAYNPYGINAVTYDCDDKTLWVSAIDETSYEKQKGVIYHIDIQTRKVLQTLENIDALTLQVIRSDKGKYLLIGGARDSSLYAIEIKKGRLTEDKERLISLLNSNEHIRKIKIKGENHLQIETIPFTYALIAQSGTRDRKLYHLFWDKNSSWRVNELK